MSLVVYVLAVESPSPSPLPPESLGNDAHSTKVIILTVPQQEPSKDWLAVPTCQPATIGTTRDVNGGWGVDRLRLLWSIFHLPSTY